MSLICVDLVNNGEMINFDLIIYIYILLKYYECVFVWILGKWWIGMYIYYLVL